MLAHVRAARFPSTCVTSSTSSTGTIWYWSAAPATACGSPVSSSIGACALPPAPWAMRRASSAVSVTPRPPHRPLPNRCSSAWGCSASLSRRSRRVWRTLLPTAPSTSMPSHIRIYWCTSPSRSCASTRDATSPWRPRTCPTSSAAVSTQPPAASLGNQVPAWHGAARGGGRLHRDSPCG